MSFDGKSGDGGGEHKQLGVLLAGYLEKQNPYGKVFRKRFIVLTQDAFHWFKREEKDHLFGEERGQISLKVIETVRILDEDLSQFEILSENFTRRYFRCKDASECEEWVSAIRSAVKTISDVRRKLRKSVYNSDGQKFVDPNDFQMNDEVKVLLVSHISSSKQIETVISRQPLWNRLIFINNVYPEDTIVISTSNGGTATLSHTMLLDKADLQRPFHIPLQNVLLASSLSVLVTDVPHIATKGDAEGNTTKNGSTSLFSKLKVVADMCRIISKNQRSVQTIILSSMIFSVGIRCVCYSIFWNTTIPSLPLFYGLSLVLAVISARQVINASRESYSGISGSIFSPKDVRPESYHLIIQEHQFTSPDAPVKAPEDEIPQRFINGCDGDIREARKRWDATRKWRETESIDSVLHEEQPHFFTIKTMYPHYLCGKGKEGNYVYYERPGEIEIPQLNARGIGIDEMLRHWLFVTEYQYTHVVTGEMEKAITVIDIEQVKMSDVAGDALEFVRRSVGIANQHYPERAFLIFLVNVPSWFSFIWRLIKPMVHENTQKKVKILSKKEVLSGLAEHIEMDQIPVYYGGKMDLGGHDSCRFQSPLEIAMGNFVKKLNARCRGEAVEEDESMPITAEAINEGKNLGGEREDSSHSFSDLKKPSASPTAPKTSSMRLLSRIQEDEQSDATPDTDTVSTLSNSRSAKMTHELARSMLESDYDGPTYSSDSKRHHSHSKDSRSMFRSSSHDKYNSDEWSISTAGTSLAAASASSPANRYGRSGSSLNRMFQTIPEGSEGKQ